MLGGYQILDLRGIDLQKASVASNISNAYVLKQLLQLRDHIDKAYDFSKPLTNQLKPVLIRFRDKKNGEKTEGATFGELSVNGNYYTFKITARISGALVLTINVAFEEITNDYGNKEWVIDTATILLKDESKTITGDLELSGDLSVGDDAEITGDASVGGDLEVTGDIKGNANITGDLTVQTVEQSQANFKGDNINFVAPTGLTITNTYNRLEVINQVLYVIVNFKVENNSGETVNFSTVDLMAGLNEKYALKVYDVTGKNVHESPTLDYTFITGEPAMAVKNADTYAGTYLTGKVFICNRQTENNISLFATLDENLAMADGDYIYFTGRIALTLL